MRFSFDRVADYFAAVAALGAENDPARQRAIAAVLGLVETATEPIPAKPVTGPSPAPALPKSPREESSAVRPPPARSAEISRQPRQPSRLQYTLTRLSSPARTRPDWLEHVPPLPPPPSGGTATPPVPLPLLAPRWSRAILSTAMSRETATNTIDIDAIVRDLARGLPLRAVPRRVMPALSHGVQLLVDRGPGAAPFLADQELLIRQIRAVAGRDRVQLLRFDPSRGFIAGTGPRTRWRDYFSLPAPPPAMTVVLVSDAGTAAVPFESNALPADWRDFVVRLRARGNRVIAFVPYAPSRWPPMLRGILGMLPWDRRTSVQSVRRLLARRGRRRQVPP
ncbi:MAG TPA: hypothetical protein VEK57_16840 [Thermoanaerobaculia bacterium]|nr:hypothetical protein [Thermoanaerobaculia bacterium]